MKKIILVAIILCLSLNSTAHAGGNGLLKGLLIGTAIVAIAKGQPVYPGYYAPPPCYYGPVYGNIPRPPVYYQPYVPQPRYIRVLVTTLVNGVPVEQHIEKRFDGYR